MKANIEMSAITATALKRQVITALKQQGYVVKRDGSFALKGDDIEARRKAHELAKLERVAAHREFIIKNIDLVTPHLIDGERLDVAKIRPRIIEVKPDSKEEKMFRWWNLVWWSLPYERAYGRQMRFLIWDDYHDACIGLVGLQSPILKWSVRDETLKIKRGERDFWVNQSLSGQRIGALPPYNKVLGGKLVALLMTADVVANRFAKKYRNQKTLIKGRKLPARLLFLTTTGAYGKSSVYNRLKFNGRYVAKFIGYSSGSGSFHIPNQLYGDFLTYLGKKKVDVKRGFKKGEGTGPSRKMHLISEALTSLNFKNGTTHGIKRAVYLFPLVSNLKEVIEKRVRPIWNRRTVEELTEFWKTKWALPRIAKDVSYLEFRASSFLDDTARELNKRK